MLLAWISLHHQGKGTFFEDLALLPATHWAQEHQSTSSIGFPGRCSVSESSWTR